jgi:di/tricarboxylate transporter
MGSVEFTLGIGIVFGLIGVAALLFSLELIPNEIAALGVLVALVLLEPWTQMGPADALSGFSSPATITVLAMFILSEGVRRTGVVRLLGKKLRQLTGRSTFRHLAATVGISGPMAGVINNTPVVAVLIPTLVDLARENRISPSALLMPLSYASMMGGMLTLIGTSSTILASDLSARLIDHPIGMFEFTPLGVLVLLVGSLFLLTLGPRLIPERIRPEQDLTDTFRMQAYLDRVRVSAQSPLIGKTIEEGMTDADLDLDILQIVRGDTTYVGPFTDREIAEGDLLTLRADAPIQKTFVERMHLEKLPLRDVSDETFIDPTHTLLECTVRSDSRLEGETLISSAFRNRYGATVLAVRRGDDVVRDAIETITLREGDSLLLQTTREQEAVLHTVRDLVVTRSTPAAYRAPDEDDGANRRDKMPMALGILGAVIAVAAADLLPIVITSLAGVVAMVVTGCLKTDEAYAAVGWNVFFLMAGVIPLGLAMQKTGAATYLAGLVLSQADLLPPLLILGLFYLLTALLANLIGNNASVIIMLPIAVDAALRVGAPPFSFVLAVTFASSTAFMTPVGYQTNLMVYTPGGYRFGDFLRAGAPLQLLLAVVTTFGIALIWGV